jgi:hypothetical protein
MAEAWYASVGLFSGRPDPTWMLDRATVDAFLKSWAALPRDKRHGTWQAPQLGYRGCRVWSGSREWRLFASRTQLVEAGSPIESRHDPQRQLERWVLDTAPQSLRQLVVHCFEQTSAWQPQGGNNE